MNRLDKVISYLNPRRGFERAAWRESMDEIRNYDAGGYGRFNSRWRVFNESAEATDRNDRDVIRARARDLERNSDLANSVLIAFKRNVVGNGFKLQAKTSNPELNALLEELWQEWTKKKNCDVTGTQSFNQMLRMAVVRKKVDGGILFKKCYTKDGIVPFKLQALEVDELALYWKNPKNKKNRVVNGIEYNEYNKPMGFWIQQYSIDGFEIPEAKYYPAKDIIYYYSKKRPSQIREMSDLTPTIPRIRDANEFINAVSIKERIAACLSVFIRKAIPTATGFGRQSGFDNSNKVEYSGKSLSPGMITEMNAGDEIQVVDPKGAAADSADFLKTQQRLIGAGQGLSYECTSRDMSQTNYSSARQGAIEDEYTFSEESELLRDNLMDEVYESFVISCFLAGLFDISDFWDRKTDYLKHDWVSSPKKWIDPKKEADANKIALESNIKSFKQICAENGQDWKRQIDDMAEVANYAALKGIEIGGVAQNESKPTETEESGTE